MKFLIAILSASSLVFADTSDEPVVEQVTMLEQPTFTNPTLPETQLTGTIPVLPKHQRSSFLTVGLSFLVPGLGHVYLGDLKTAASLFGSTSALIGTNAFTHDAVSIITASNMWSYGIFAAYRDVRINNGQSGYTYRMPNDSFSDLATAPFRWSVMKKPEVWGGLLGALTLGTVVSYLAFSDMHINTCSISSNIFPLAAFSVGVGEESFFRGYLQSYLAERLNPTGAIVLSSLVFGAVHIPNAQAFAEEDRWRYYSFSLPLITSLGGYMGWLTHKNRSLKSGVALHAWYDFTLFLASAVATPTAMVGKPQFAYSFEF